MAKNVSHKKSKLKDQQTLKSRHTIQFLFPITGDLQTSSKFLLEYANKIKTEYSARTSIYGLYTGDPPLTIEHRLVRYLAMDQTDHSKINDAFQKGYTVILESGSLEKQINPNEFFRLSIPEDSRQRIYYDISFQGKKNIDRAGVIIPAEAVSYLLAIAGHGKSPEPEYARIVLEKLGFERKEVSYIRIPHSNSHSLRFPFFGRR